jgi:4-aminobutyrate aminotransferase
LCDKIVKVRIRSGPPGPNAKVIIEVMKANCYDSTFTYPLVISSGAGCIIKDVDGNEFLDFSSNIGTCPLGYSHPEILDVLSRYANNGAHKIAGQDFYCKEHADLSEVVKSIIPSRFKTFFVNSGAEAVENAIKLAYRKMSTITPSLLPGISCFNAFHGRTLGALSFTLSKPIQKAGYPELPVLRIKFCSADDDPKIEEVSNVLEQNKAAFIITEVVQGEGGYNFASRNFIQKLRHYADQYAVPLIFDEVQSGMGRTGKWWAFEHYDVTPDIMSAAKALQVGMSAFDPKFEPSQQGALSSTWGGGSRIDMAVGAATINVIKKDRLLENAVVMGERLKKGVTDLSKEAGSGMVGVRSLGLMMGLEFDSKVRRDHLILKAFRKGLLLLPAGQKSMRVIPPLIITREEIDEGLDLMQEIFLSA